MKAAVEGLEQAAVQLMVLLMPVEGAIVVPAVAPVWQTNVPALL